MLDTLFLQIEYLNIFVCMYKSVYNSIYYFSYTYNVVEINCLIFWRTFYLYFTPDIN